MEALTRLVADSLARHGLDRPVDPRRLQWSRWFHCDSPHSLLVVPSKPGIFALAEEIMDLGVSGIMLGSGPARSAGEGITPQPASSPATQGAAFVGPGRKSGVGSQIAKQSPEGTAPTPMPPPPTRMLAALQFSEDDDMAFTLDRMFTGVSPMRGRLASGRCFLRFVVIEDQAQRRNICNALNQWMLSSAERASGIGADFQSSLELTVERTCPEMQSKGPSPASVDSARISAEIRTPKAMQETAPPAPHLDSGANRNLHCPHPLPSGF